LFALGTAAAVPACSSLPRDAQVGDLATDSATSDDSVATEDADQVLQGSYGAPVPFPVPIIEGRDGSSEAATDAGRTDAGDAGASDAATDASASDGASEASMDADADLDGVMADAAYGVPPDGA
jgi:hypothetical protein